MTSADLRTAQQIARDILEGRTSMIEGVRHLTVLASRLAEVVWHDPVLGTFAAVDSETDCLPVGPVRELWNSEALREQDVEIAQAELFYRAKVENACRDLLARQLGEP